MSAAEPIRVLVAEDVPTDAEQSVRGLKRAGPSMAQRIADSEDGLRGASAEFAPQVVPSDFTLPRFDGRQALALTREVAPAPELRSALARAGVTRAESAGSAR